MKNLNLQLILLVVVSVLISCKSQQVSQQNDGNNSEVWDEGVSQISGVISKVTQEKDGQTIELYNNKGVHYTAIISIPNLGENHAQYREFKVGEQVNFKGNLHSGQFMVVREILEMR